MKNARKQHIEELCDKAQVAIELKSFDILAEVVGELLDLFKEHFHTLRNPTADYNYNSNIETDTYYKTRDD